MEIDYIDDGIASLRWASDEDPYITAEYVPPLRQAVERLAADESVRAVVVEGGARHFNAGASSGALLTVQADGTVDNFAPDLPRIVLSLPVPTVAAMAGHATGAGFILGLWCDIVVLAEESLYGANFMALGFTPGVGATTVLEEIVGGPLARELLFTGRLVKGREFKTTGGALAHAVVPRAEVRDRAIAIAREVADVPREALVLLKKTLAQRRREKLESALKEEHRMHTVIFSEGETRVQIAQRYPTTITL